MPRNSNDFSETYSKMSDDELLRIKADSASLVEEAKQALESELQKRQITISNDTLEVESQTEATTRTPEKRKNPWWIRLGLVFAFWIGLNHTAAQSIADVKIRLIIFFIFIVWGITQIIAGRTIKRTLIIAAVYIFIGIGWYGTLHYKSKAQKERIHEILQEVKKDMPEDTKNRLAAEEISQRKITSFADFEKQCADLQSLQNQSEVMEKRKKHMLTELQYEFRDDPNVQKVFNILFQMEDLADKSEPTLREMIDCSKILASKSKAKQDEYRTICIDPAQQQSMLIEPDMERLTSELQKEVQLHGETLPPDILQLVGH